MDEAELLGRFERRSDILSMDEIGNFISRSAAEQEAEGDAKLAIELRKQCETIIGFTEYRMQRYVPDRHHRFVAEQLERVERREIDRLILEMPPRHGKSELASKSYPAFAIGRNPSKQIISASADNRLAVRHGRYVRNIIASERFKLAYPGVEPAEDSKSAGLWETKQGGIYISASVGSAIMGSGADDYLIDDPYGSMQDARSETIRDGVWEWFNGTVYNRLQPGGAIILINPRGRASNMGQFSVEKPVAPGSALSGNQQSSD